MELKGRLKLIADKIPKCSTLCDIGTDHAYIPIYCVIKGICEKAIAADIRKGPLLIAKENIMRYGLERYIETRQGDGLEPVHENEADVIVVAGMGGILIRDILARDYEKAKRPLFILQPMNAPEVLREWLYSEGFDIIDEELAQEGNKFYNVILAKWTGVCRRIDKIYYYIGEQLIQKRDPLAEKFIRKKLGQVEKVLKQLDANGQGYDEVRQKYEWMRKSLLGLLESLG